MVDVTLHAQIRWLERVEGEPVEAIRERLSRVMPGTDNNVLEGAVLHEILRRTRRTNVDLLNTILTPSRRMAIECGATRINLPCGHVIRIKNDRICNIDGPSKKFASPGQKRRRKRRQRTIRKNGYA